MRRLFIPVILVILSAVAAAAQAAGAAHPEMLVSTEWLAKHAGDANLVLVQVGSRDSDYRRQHIPGARFLNMDKFADMEAFPGTELLSPEKTRKNLEDFGISDGSHVVVYSPEWDPLATRLIYTLDFIGFKGTASLLDGGIDHWVVAEKRPSSIDIPPPLPHGHLTVTPHPEVLVKMDAMNKLVAGQGDAKSVVIDSRPRRRYTTGHLPGAAWFYWENAFVSPDVRILRSPGELRQLFAEAGVKSGMRSVSYCEVGQQASFTYFLARYLGLDAAMYDGSFNEWSNTPNQPVVKGDKAR